MSLVVLKRFCVLFLRRERASFEWSFFVFKTRGAFMSLVVLKRFLFLKREGVCFIGFWVVLLLGLVFGFVGVF